MAAEAKNWCCHTVLLIIKQPWLNKAKNGKDQRETLTVKTISTSIFRHVNNYIVEKHEKRKMLL